MSTVWESLPYEDSDEYPARIKAEARDAVNGVFLVAWTVIAAYSVGLFILLLRWAR